MGFVAVKCPQCGADIQLDDSREFGFCNYCGTKVMQDKIVVEHSGSVKVDNSEYVEKFLQNARRAKLKEDWEETEKYYNLVEQNDPFNIEAIFYSSFGKAKQSLIDSDLYKRQAAFNVLTRCVSIIDDNYQIEDEEKNKPVIEQIGNDIMKMAGSQYVYNYKKNGYGITVSSDKDETIRLFGNLSGTFVDSIRNIIRKYPSGDKRKAFYYEVALKQLTFMLKNYDYDKQGAANLKKIVSDLHTGWKSVDPAHIIPDEVTTGKEDEKAFRKQGFFYKVEANELKRTGDAQKAKKITNTNAIIYVVISLFVLVLGLAVSCLSSGTSGSGLIEAAAGIVASIFFISQYLKWKNNK
ncbi:MAG: zinc ribbon domain-containing protein [Clostridia bacterium]|nr:zinc ribbon domain-containing protein [Clostridia bacterium]